MSLLPGEEQLWKVLHVCKLYDHSGILLRNTWFVSPFCGRHGDSREQKEGMHSSQNWEWAVRSEEVPAGTHQRNALTLLNLVTAESGWTEKHFRPCSGKFSL